MDKKLYVHRLTIESANPQRLAALCGQFNEHVKFIEQRVGVSIRHRGSHFDLTGDSCSVLQAQFILRRLYDEASKNTLIALDQVHLIVQHALQQYITEQSKNKYTMDSTPDIITTRKGSIKTRGHNQSSYVAAIESHDITFGIGPAGTGKTYLAVACAVQALQKEKIQKILLVRPAVEAGEKLGFLPGDLNQKVDPYLRPLYDALHEMFGLERTCKLIEQNVIEVAPLAYMRGRTLNHAFIILDESQNTTVAQMKMFLTRIGFGSTAVITGDITQIDLPKNIQSGLFHALQVLASLDSINITHFSARDVVRHPVVQKIIEAYNHFEQHQAQISKPPTLELSRNHENHSR